MPRAGAPVRTRAVQVAASPRVLDNRWGSLRGSVRFGRSLVTGCEVRGRQLVPCTGIERVASFGAQPARGCGALGQVPRGGHGCGSNGSDGGQASCLGEGDTRCGSFEIFNGPGVRGNGALSIFFTFVDLYKKSLRFPEDRVYPRFSHHNRVP